MADDFGTQNSFDKFSRSTERLDEGINIFGRSVGDFVTAAYGIREAFGDKVFRKAVNVGIKIIGVGSLVDAIEDFISTTYNVKKDLGRTLGMTARQQEKVSTNLRRAMIEAQGIGISPEETQAAFQTIISEFRDLNMEASLTLTKVSTQAARRFNMAAEEAAKMSSSMMMFGGVPANEIESVFDGISATAREFAVPINEVGRAMAENVDSMYKFDLRTQEARQEFSKMVVESARLGYNLGNVVQAADKFRDFGEAMEASAMAGRFGMALDPRQLMAAGMTGDVQGIIDPLFQRIEQVGIFDDGRLNQVGVGIADSIGAAMGLSREEIAAVMKRRQQSPGVEFSQALDNMREENRRNAKIQERFQARMNQLIGNVLLPVLDSLLGPIESMGSANLNELWGSLEVLTTSLGEMFVKLVPYVKIAAEKLDAFVPVLTWGIKKIVDHLGLVVTTLIAIKTLQFANKLSGGALGAMGRRGFGRMFTRGRGLVNTGANAAMAGASFSRVPGVAAMGRGAMAMQAAGGPIKATKGLLKTGGAKLFGGFGKLAGKGFGKVAGKGLLKSIGKKIPGVGLLLGGGFALQRAMEGDLLGAGGELASGLASMIPGIGTAASVAIDAAMMARDANKNMEKSIEPQMKQMDKMSSSLDQVAMASRQQMINRQQPIEVHVRSELDGRKVGQGFVRAVQET